MKGVHWRELREAGADVVLANTYHLMLRPGAERIASLGGLHAFINWPYPILTDSGGFQVMSLAELRKVEERGVTFRSHVDGAIDRAQRRSARSRCSGWLGADIAMQLDECVRLPAEAPEIERAMRLSLRWASVASVPLRRMLRAGARCSASCREATMRACAGRARASSSAWLSTATPSAGSPSASRRRPCWR